MLEIVMAELDRLQGKVCQIPTCLPMRLQVLQADTLELDH
jgi:hypothetical protein